MKVTSKKRLTVNDEEKINRVLLWVTLILIICSYAMRHFGVFADVNKSFEWFLWAGFLSALCYNSNLKRNLRAVTLATNIICDAMYVISLFFLLGRAFVRNL